MLTPNESHRVLYCVETLDDPATESWVVDSEDDIYFVRSEAEEGLLEARAENPELSFRLVEYVPRFNVVMKEG